MLLVRWLISLKWLWVWMLICCCYTLPLSLLLYVLSPCYSAPLPSRIVPPSKPGLAQNVFLLKGVFSLSLTCLTLSTTLKHCYRCVKNCIELNWVVRGCVGPAIGWRPSPGVHCLLPLDTWNRLQQTPSTQMWIQAGIENGKMDGLKLAFRLWKGIIFTSYGHPGHNHTSI